MNTIPYYWRLSAFYLFYFGSFGALMPYWGLYLQALGFDAQAIGELIAIVLFLICFLIQVSHGPYYTFYSIYLEDYGYSRKLIGQLLALGLIAEVGVFLIMHRLLRHFRLNTILIISLVLTGSRWLLIGYYVEFLTVLFWAQLLNAVSYATYHGVAMQIIRQTFADHHLGRAQALYSSVSFGAGGAVGSLLSGYTWDRVGAQLSYFWAAVICFVGVWISWHWVDWNNHSEF